MDTALRQTQGRAPREVIIVWPDTQVPSYVRELIDKIKAAHGSRIALIKVRPTDVERMLGYLDVAPEEVPEIHRSFIALLRQYGVRKMPALIVDGQLVAVGEDDVEEALRSLVRSPPLV